MDPARVVTKAQLVKDLRQLGVAEGDVLMTHESISAVGWVLGGPAVVGSALLEVIGPAGTWIKYVGSEDSCYEMELWPEEVQKLCREHFPPFNPATTRACREWGILTEYLRTWPGALRSAHPDGSFAAVGPKAAWLIAPHPLQNGLGPGSPLERIIEGDGKVLLLGAPYETATLIHHSEYVAHVPNKRRVCYQTPIQGESGQAQWVQIEELDSSNGIADYGPGDYFHQIVTTFVAEGQARTGLVGHAHSVLMEARKLHEFAVAWLEGNRVS